ncbi:cytochrome P450 [Triangularia setosa]|uniref:Cytochrome P450 n=1 Tax=Triangularia setosa TaxID=2587417 RepID=A0AAN7A4S0_9PEZI|nr:cytochrome P450 [Podospora setosa]
MTIYQSILDATTGAPLPFVGILLGIAFATAQTVAIIRTAFLSPLSKIPGPFHARFTSLRLTYSVFSNNRIHYVHSLHKRYGPIVRIAPHEIDVADPASAREIHKMGSGFPKAPFYALLSPGPVDNIFNFRNPKLHSARRRLYAKGFTLSSLRKEWEPTIRDTVALTVAKIKADATGKGGGAEVMGWWTLMANELVCQLTFGGGRDTVKKGVKDPFVLMLERRMGDLAHLLKHFVPPVYYLGRMLALVVTPLHDVFYSQEKMFSAGDRVVAQARSEKIADRGRNLFAKALAEEQQQQQGGGDGVPGLSDTDIITDAGALLLAGSDPTAISLTFLLWCVLHRPELQREVEAEVAGMGGEVTDVACEGLPVLNAVIDESLRLYGAAPGSMPRSVPKGGATIGGYYIPDDTVVVTQNWSLHRDPAAWENPDVFDHTRWLPGNQLSERAKISFNPFGYGARQCLGMHLGRIEMRLAAAMFFRECAGAKLAASATPESMVVVDSFIAGVPKSRRLEITMKEGFSSPVQTGAVCLCS